MRLHSARLRHDSLHLRDRAGRIRFRAAPLASLDSLLERRDTIYDNLRDLRFEHRAGKFSDSDYDEMRQALEAEAARVLAEMDQLTGSVPTPATRQAMSKKPRDVVNGIE